MSRTTKKILIAILIPTVYAVILRLLFGIKTWTDIFSVMSITFLFCLPTIVGALTVYLSDYEKVKSLTYRFFMPWVPVFLFLVITMFLKIEGWACWLMILPIFLIASSFGGLIGGYLKNRKGNSNLNVSLLVLIPLLIGPVESLFQKIPATYTAYTSIEINAPAEVIWQNVTAVRKIDEKDDKGYLNRIIGFPRPLEAVLNYKGVGAYREARFTKGLVFHETVKEYEENKRMLFSIKAYPYEIPSTTLDEHVVIGGNYFDVLDGTYELEKISHNKYKLILYSRFKLNTTFNFYSGLWAKWIMKDIQNNILQIEKKRAESVKS
ncbi:hypothetical protein [Epilithonimonas sp.]|uniref:hypothetical protein n=1 Tax=Epilithonimonas sp. TaxID=2894511 RepID=UPI00289E14B5|nr:hypothetical protein [Epilithonimonas sp.]